MNKSTLNLILSLILMPVMLLGMTGAKQADESEEGPPYWDGHDAASHCPEVIQPITGVISGDDATAWEIELVAGTYTVAAWASYDIRSFSLSVIDSSGHLIASDEGDDNHPVLEFEMDGTESVHLQVRSGPELIEGTPAEFSLVVGRGEDCWTRPPNIAKTLLNLWSMISMEETCEILDWDVVDLTEHGDRLEYSYDLMPGEYYVVAETTDRSNDIDMYVKLDGETISINELPDNTPVCWFELIDDAEIEVIVDLYEVDYEEVPELVYLISRSTGW